MITITIGDDIAIKATLKKDGALVIIDPSSTVSAAITLPDRSTSLIAAKSQPSTNSGSDWANGVVSVMYTSTESSVTIANETIRAVLEVQVSDPSFGKQTYTSHIKIEKGTIA